MFPSTWSIYLLSKLFCFCFFSTSAYAHDLHQMLGDAIDEPLDLCVSYVALSFTYHHICLEDLLHVSSTGTIYPHVSDPSSYVLPQNTYENYPFSIPIGYDYQFLLQGPFLNQTYPNITQIALFTQQNIMLKHDFLTFINVIYYLRLMMFCDISHSRFHSKQRHKVLHKLIIQTTYP